MIYLQQGRLETFVRSFIWLLSVALILVWPILSLSLSSLLYDGRHRPFCGFISYEWSDMIIDPGMIF